MQNWKRFLPTVAKRKSENSEESSFIQSKPETEMKATAEDQKEEVHTQEPVRRMPVLMIT